MHVVVRVAILELLLHGITLGFPRCIEALTRAGEFERPLLQRAITMFEDFLQYSNHVGLCTEEISEAGEGLGNAVQGFTHVTLISAAYNLSRTMAMLK
jgi:GH15 family glucan-1,4-alpha-glucosidase